MRHISNLSSISLFRSLKHSAMVTGLPPMMHLLVGARNTKGGSITVLLTSCLTGLESVYNFHFYLRNRLIQAGQTGGQLYSDNSPFSVPW
jgi:hypothetical protein